MDKATFLMNMDEYLDGQLTGQELTEFTDMLANDKECSRELQLHKVLRAKIRKAARNAFKEELGEIQGSHVKSSLVMMSMEEPDIQVMDSEPTEQYHELFSKISNKSSKRESPKRHSQKAKRMWVTGIAASLILGLSVVFLYTYSGHKDAHVLVADSIALSDPLMEFSAKKNLEDTITLKIADKIASQSNVASKVLYSGKIEVQTVANQRKNTGESIELYIRVYENKHAWARVNSDTLLVFVTPTQQKRIDWQNSKILLSKDSLDIVSSNGKNINIPRKK